MAEPIRINLALQGGGAHGAFTWGVLDRLLEDDEIEVAAISGTSAGALNAAAFKAGMVRGGRAGARENLDWLWGEIGAVENAAISAWLNVVSPATSVLAKMIEYSPAYTAFDAVSRMSSPYVFGGLIRNPLTRIVEKFQFDKVHSGDGPELFICATNVRTGKIRVFQDGEIGVQAILASACLPTLFEAVELTDPVTGTTEAFWDGGYTGNPALFPLYEARFPDDIVIVNINPLYREEIPEDAQAIQNRINEISFNSSLLRDLRAIQFVKRLIGEGAVEKGRMKDVLVHMIADDPLMNELNVATKTIPNPVVIARLREAGRGAAAAFLSAHKGDLGKRGTVDLVSMFG